MMNIFKSLNRGRQEATKGNNKGQKKRKKYLESSSYVRRKKGSTLWNGNINMTR
jgi:hypothetical protein